MVQKPIFSKKKTTLNPYMKQQIQSASPEKLILIMYDLGIQSCYTKNKQKAIKVLVELIAALNFDHRDMAVIFFDLYKYALDYIHKEKFKEPRIIFEALRDVWVSSVMSTGTVQKAN